MTYAAAIAYLYSLQKHGIKLGLDNMRALLARLGHPERRLRMLHVGGTNGKGSTAALAAAMVQAAGYRTGLYTSPHLVDFRERIRIDHAMIAESAVADLTGRLQAVLSPELQPTFFELTTAMALLYFAEVSAEVVVLEVGLGGRFDATNVVEPLASAITTIGLDHQEFLGDTEAAIAGEKAGIIKPGVPVVLGRMSGEALAVMRAAAAERGAPCWEWGRDFEVVGAGPEQCTYRGPGRTVADLSCPLAGRHQLDNVACAVALIDAAEGRGLVVPDEAVRRGIGAVQWEGRLEWCGARPALLLDGAHNPAAARVVAAYVRDWLAARPGARLILVWGMMGDKDRQGFWAPFQGLTSDVVLTQADLARSAPVSVLRQVVMGQPVRCHEAPRVPEALDLARRLASEQDLICVTGSLMLVGDVKACLRGGAVSPLRG